MKRTFQISSVGGHEAKEEFFVPMNDTLSSEIFKGVTASHNPSINPKGLLVSAMSYLSGSSPSKYCCHCRA